MLDIYDLRCQDCHVKWSIGTSFSTQSNVTIIIDVIKNVYKTNSS